MKVHWVFTFLPLGQVCLSLFQLGHNCCIFDSPVLLSCIHYQYCSTPKAVFKNNQLNKNLVPQEMAGQRFLVMQVYLAFQALWLSAGVVDHLINILNLIKILVGKRTGIVLLRDVRERRELEALPSPSLFFQVQSWTWGKKNNRLQSN